MNGPHSAAFDPSDLDLLGQREWILRLARRMVDDPALAEDATQDTLLDALRQGWSGQLLPSARLAAIVRNKLRSRLRADNRRRWREEQVAREERVATHADLLDQAEAHRNLVVHVLALGEGHRLVLLQRYFEGLTPREIARREGTSPETVSRRLNRAHAALRERLERDGGEAGWLGAFAPLVSPGIRRPSWVASVSPPLFPILAMKILVGAAVLTSVVVLGLVLLTQDRPTSSLRPETDSATVVAIMVPQRPGSELAPIAEPGPAERTAGAPATPDATPRATLEGTIVDESENPVPGFELRLRDGSGRQWSAPSTEDGRVALAGLPAGRDLELALWRGDELWRTEPAPLRLAAGENGPLRWQVQLHCTVRGVAVDASGRPVPDAELMIRPRGRHSSEIARRAIEGDGSILCSADVEGRFEFEPIEPGRYLVGPSGRIFEDMYRDDGTPYRLRIRHPAATVLESLDVPIGSALVETTVRVFQGHEITGRVLFPDGSPAADVALMAKRDDLAGSFTTETGEDGSFRLEAMAPGEYVLTTVAAPAGFGLFRALRVATGARDVELILDVGGSLSGSVIEPRSETSMEGWLHVLQDEHGLQPAAGVVLPLFAGDEFAVATLAPSSYSLRFDSLDHQWYGLRRGVLIAGGHELTDQRVEILPAAQLRVEAGDAEGLRVFVELPDGGLYCRLPVSAESPRTVAVPPGLLIVRLESLGEQLEEIEIETTVGEQTLVRFDAP
ncbi:sigma-70 family RNA polymerase sigma factor [Engelhardtia mirabilis]|uniref:RNA polymerase sigma factor n=1 Tax=Engelhardtia mirabilis TaxID=2528011 RepID=A0A518BGG8_9BACT|nr:RNA polymerase sigma factor [Planctomycetes bacterium Pla133]QDV00406.1 RNA polymerase sigma factor [Planctomycetes bacterium Pla86]